MALLQIRDLSFSYASSSNDDPFALSGITLDVEAGEIVVICGKSASGKTTLLRLLKPPIAPAGRMEGCILFKGSSLESLDDRILAASIGFVMQDPDAQICTDKVMSELAFGLENLGLSQHEMQVRMAEVTTFFGLSDILERNTASLSGGQKQLLNLAAAAALRPDLMILDEPLAQLDPVSRSTLLNMLKRLNSEFGITIIMAEHSTEDVLSMADRVLFLEGGSVSFSGAPRSVLLDIFERRADLPWAIPASARIYLYVAAKRGRLEKVRAEDIPLTVREAKMWLKDKIGSFSPLDSAPESASEKAAASTILSSTSTDDSVQAADPIVSMHDVWFRYEKDSSDVLRGCTFSAGAGASVALLGGNGCGKSTLLKAISGQLKPYAGSVRLFGKKLQGNKKEHLSRIAYLPQDPTLLFREDTVRLELQSLFSTNSGRDVICKKAIEDIAAKALYGAMDANPFDISGGQKQLVALLKVLMLDKDIILLDEPTKGMDLTLRQELHPVLQFLSNAGKCILIATHDIELAAHVCNMAALVFDGCVTDIMEIEAFLEESFIFTTAARRISAGLVPSALTCEEVVEGVG